MEVDAALADRAARALSAAGYAPHAVHGDGAWGLPGAGPFDRIVVTCGVRRVPPDLLTQLRPSGVLVAPLCRDFWSGALVRLTAGAGAVAEGRFHGGASYMPMRSHRAADDAVGVDGATARRRAGALPPARLLDLGFALYAGARLPGVRAWHSGEGDGVELWFQDGSRSAAHAAAREVWEYGPRDLWREVERVEAEYAGLGRPSADAFGLTVTAAGQRLWLASPRRVVGPAPWATGVVGVGPPCGGGAGG
ncbi:MULTISPECIES: protein-L-isoaspartate O-methyltransferase family protein [Streptomyces]|uniref:protein-L-isoaspartate O-methyltransferase family protein n=1 Tax=Streptomyces TaxID=1883 RepID=UPI000A8481A7|nr:hypothetical protein [Streptomyces changanensis]